MRKINIKTLHEVAPLRLPGYLDAVRARGRVEGDAIILSDEDFDVLRRQYQVPGIASEALGPVAKQRFAVCKSCAQSKEAGFGCFHHIGCCFGRWRSQPESKCPEGKW
ncbi:MAG: hypothetical protein PHW60_05715 [Kiritimatiellae bacterium]|nr:hypothetical protein [Kiritimatiellia bacterium]